MQAGVPLKFCFSTLVPSCVEGRCAGRVVPLWSSALEAWSWRCVFIAMECLGWLQRNTTPAQLGSSHRVCCGTGLGSTVPALSTANRCIQSGYSAPLLRDHARQTRAGALIAPALLPPLALATLCFGLPYAHKFVQRPPKWVGGDEMWCCGLVVRQWRVAFQSSKAERH